MPSLSDLFGSLTGSTQSNAAKKAAEFTKTGLQNAYDLGKPLIQQGYTDANGFLTQGYNTASGTLQGGLNSAWGALNAGGTAATDYLNAGYGTARSDLNSLYDKARAANSGALDTITGLYQPYIASGTGAQSLYDTFLGLNGADAAKSASASFAGNDPGIAYRMDMLDKQSAARANAAGYLGSGREAMARDRVQSEMLSQDYNAYLNRLAEQAARGGQYTGQLAGFTDASGAREAQLYGRQGDQLSALEQGRARDLAQNERQHATSLVDLISNTARGQAGLDSGYYSGMAGNALSQGTKLADLIMGKETGIANTNAQSALAQGQAASSGLNNLINLGSLGLQAWQGLGKPQAPVYSDAGTAANGGWSTTANTPTAGQKFWNMFS